MNDFNLSFNPFALSTIPVAKQEEKNLSVGKTSQAMAYVTNAHDIYVKNPFALTIGNCIAVMNSADRLSTKTKITVAATVAFGSLYTLMLYGATTHLAGRLLLASEKKVRLAALASVGKVTKKFGTKLFVTGAVPVYGLFYALPKQMVLSIPKIADFVVIKVSVLANWVFQNVLQPFWDKTILPALRVIENAIHKFTTTLTSVLKALSEKISYFAEEIFEQVIAPLWNRIIDPLIKAIVNKIDCLKEILENLISNIFNKVAEVAQRIIQEVIAPFLDCIVVPCMEALSDGIVYLAKAYVDLIWAVVDKVGQVAEWVFREMIVPVWKRFLLPILTTVGDATYFTAKIIAKSIKALARATVEVAYFIFKKIIIPVSKAIGRFLAAAGTILGNYVVKPVISSFAILAEKIGDVFKALFEGFIIPTAKGFASVAKVIKESAFDLKREIWRTADSIWNQIVLRRAS